VSKSRCETRHANDSPGVDPVFLTLVEDNNRAFELSTESVKAAHVEWPDITSAAFVGAVMSDNGSETAVEKGVAMSAMDPRIVNKANGNI